MAYLLSLDQGTSSSRAIIFDDRGRRVSICSQKFPQKFPQPGWVEHDPEDIWCSQRDTAIDALRQIDPSECVAIGITNQRETTIVWDAATGKPVYNAIVWQDRRTAEYCSELAPYAEIIRSKTGLLADPYFSASKIDWILKNVPGVRERAERGELRFGTVDSWLVWKLTGGKVHVTDVTNASRTMLFNIHTLQWDEELLKIFNIPASMLPEVVDSNAIVGEAQIGGASIPIAAMMGDQQSALFGQLCTEPGCTKNTYGTGCFLLMNTGSTPVQSSNGLLTTVAWKMGENVAYALEGSVFVAGSAKQWMIDGLQISQNCAGLEGLAASVEDNGGVYFVPALTGLGAPWWNADARGIICGLSRGTTVAHIARACLEGIALQTMDVAEAMSKDAGVPLKELKVDGGASQDNILMQIQADLLAAEVIRPKETETTALGVAYAAGLSKGVFKSIDQLKANCQIDRVFSPSMSEDKVEKLRAGWADAISRTMLNNKGNS